MMMPEVGTFYLEAIMGGDRSVHIAFVMHLLGTECDYGCNLHHKHTKLALPFEKCARKFVHPSQYWF